MPSGSVVYFLYNQYLSAPPQSAPQARTETDTSDSLNFPNLVFVYVFMSFYQYCRVVRNSVLMISGDGWRHPPRTVATGIKDKNYRRMTVVLRSKGRCHVVRNIHHSPPWSFSTIILSSFILRYSHDPPVLREYPPFGFACKVLFSSLVSFPFRQSTDRTSGVFLPEAF